MAEPITIGAIFLDSPAQITYIQNIAEVGLKFSRFQASKLLEFGYRDGGPVWGLKTISFEGAFLLKQCVKLLLLKAL